MKLKLICYFFTTVLLSASSLSYAQDSLSPPSLGQETKGTPAISETAPLPVEGEQRAEEQSIEQGNHPLGYATVTETRRENGQIYRIELEHSLSGAKQVIEETDSDGNLESRSMGLDEEINLPKWRIGSW